MTVSSLVYQTHIPVERQIALRYCLAKNEHSHTTSLDSQIKSSIITYESTHVDGCQEIILDFKDVIGICVQLVPSSRGVFGFPNFYRAVTINTKKMVINISKGHKPRAKHHHVQNQANCCCNSLRSSEQLVTIGCQTIDGTAVPLDLSKRREGVGVPKAKHPSSAPSEERRGAWHHSQSTNPVSLGTDQLFENKTTHEFILLLRSFLIQG